MEVVGEPVVRVELGEGQQLRLASWEDMADHRDPRAPGALVKVMFRSHLSHEQSPIQCCLLAAGLCKQGGSPTVRLGGAGLSVTTWSELPQGSGLGTSSILAGAVVGAVWAALGAAFTRDQVRW